MMLEGEYEPSAMQWARDQVEAYERSGGQRANTLPDTDLPVIIVTMRGNKTGKVRKEGAILLLVLAGLQFFAGILLLYKNRMTSAAEKS